MPPACPVVESSFFSRIEISEFSGFTPTSDENKVEVIEKPGTVSEYVSKVLKIRVSGEPGSSGEGSERLSKYSQNSKVTGGGVGIVLTFVQSAGSTD